MSRTSHARKQLRKPRISCRAPIEQLEQAAADDAVRPTDAKHTSGKHPASHCVVAVAAGDSKQFAGFRHAHGRPAVA